MSNQHIQSFVTEHAAVKPNADIQERWAGRVEAQGMHVRGAQGAEAYLGKYGKGMKAPKAVMFARMAELKGHTEFANRFWEEAFFLATGERQSLSGHSAPAAVQAGVATGVVKESFKQLPELLTAVDLAEAMRLANDPNIGLQEKKDGRRLMVRTMQTPGGLVVSAGNKKGLLVSPALGIADAATKLGAVELDGEDVAGVYYVFDLLSHGGKNLRNLGYAERYARLAEVVAASGGDSASLKLVPLYVTREEKLAAIEALRARKAEGFVLKPLDASYTEGEGAQRKHQFRAVNAFVVGAQNGLKRSVQISVTGSDGQFRDMGFVTVPANQSIPAPGSIVEVEYLYCHTGKAGKLHQPVYKGVRDDAVAADCTAAKLKVKADDDE